MAHDTSWWHHTKTQEKTRWQGQGCKRQTGVPRSPPEPSWVYFEVRARLDQRVLSKPDSCCCWFCPQRFWWLLHGSKFEIALRGYSYFTLPAELRGVGGGGAFNFYCGHLGRSISSLVVPGGQDCLTLYLGGLEHSGHSRTFLPPFQPTPPSRSNSNLTQQPRPRFCLSKFLKSAPYHLSVLYFLDKMFPVLLKLSHRTLFSDYSADSQCPLICQCPFLKHTVFWGDKWKKQMSKCCESISKWGL